MGALSNHRVVSVASVSPAISAQEDINPSTNRNVAEFVTHPRLHLSEARAVLRKHAKWLIYTAFPARSRYATCQLAAATFGVSPDTIERIIEGDTANPCPLILGYCARVIRQRTGQPTPVCRVLGHIIAGSME
jgi:hypothetical protein